MKKLQTIFLAILPVMSTLIFALQTGTSTYQFKQVLENKVQETLQLQAKDAAGRIGSQLDMVGKTVFHLASDIEALPHYDSQLIMTITKSYIANEPLLFGGGFWLEPYAYNAQTKYYGPYVFKLGQGKYHVTWDYSNSEYNYHAHDWYRKGLQTKNAVAWSEPYLDYVTSVQMITAASPILKNGQIVGVTTIDVHITSFLNEISKIQVGSHGYAFLVSSEGLYLNHPAKEKNLAMKITEDTDEAVRSLGKEILEASGTELRRLLLDGIEMFAVFTPVGNTGMKLVLIMPVADAYGPVTAIVHENILLFIAAIFLFALLLTFLFNRKISRPIQKLMEAADQIGKGNLSTPVQQDSKDELGHLALSLEAMREKLADFVSQLQLANTQLSEAYEVTIRAFYEALERRESSTAEHSLELNVIALEIGRRMDLSEEQLRHLNWGTLLHDIGKLAIPDRVLLKPGKLTFEEYELIKKHPTLGYEILNGADYLKETAEIALYHQEKFDGSGYPNGLKGKEIPLLARICTVADAFQAMIADRPYRKGLSMEEAIEEIQRCSGTHFDPEIVEVFLTLDHKTLLKRT